MESGRADAGQGKIVRWSGRPEAQVPEATRSAESLTCCAQPVFVMPRASGVAIIFYVSLACRAAAQPRERCVCVCVCSELASGQHIGGQGGGSQRLSAPPSQVQQMQQRLERSRYRAPPRREPPTWPAPLAPRTCGAHPSARALRRRGTPMPRHGRGSSQWMRFMRSSRQRRRCRLWFTRTQTARHSGHTSGSTTPGPEGEWSHPRRPPCPLRRNHLIFVLEWAC